MALVFSGAMNAPAPDPATIEPDPATIEPDPGSVAPPAQPPGQDGADAGAGSSGNPQQRQAPAPLAGTGGKGAALGAGAPADARAFYTKAQLVEFLAQGGAAPPAAALAAKYPAGGRIINIMTGGTTGIEPESGDMVLEETLELASRPAESPAASAPPPSPDMEAPEPMVTADVAMPMPAEGGAAAGAAGAPAPPSPDHSETNIQVEGVDEPDFVKNDARHIYILEGGELTVIDALPAELVEVIAGDSAGEIRESYRPEDASIVFRGRIGEPDGYRYDNMFLDGDSLIVIYEARQWASVPVDEADPTRAVAMPLPFTYVLWVDISNRSAARPASEYVVDGEYSTARMIDGTVYLVTRTGLDGQWAGLPGVRHSELGGRAPGIPCDDPKAARAAPGQAGLQAPPGRICSSDPIVPPALYIGPVEGRPILTTVSALPSGGPAAAAAQTYVLGGGDIEYVSRSAAYLAMPGRAPGAAEILGGLRDTGLLLAMVGPIGVQWRQAALDAAADDSLPANARLEAVLSAVQSGYDGLGAEKRREALVALEDVAWSWSHAVVPADPRTDIHRIAIGGGPSGTALSYGATGSVRGEPLDQFSMDEHGGKLRVATNVQNGRDPPHTAVHVLAAHSMETAASLEGIAPGETMRSGRFAGDTLFLVTFRQIDPFFVVDMSGTVPVILGELKIPGFSTYLQPYGADAVVGIGEYWSENRDDSRHDGGVKVSLYDVSDYRRPILADEYVIGGADAWSPAQLNHRALLADEGRGIIALPVTYTYNRPLDGEAAPDGGAAPGTYGWTGFYAFRVADGGGGAGGARLGDAHIIQHGVISDGGSEEGRSLYIADWLYTIYDGTLVVSDLYDPGRRIKSIDLG